MALLSCAECSGNVSDQADVCPHCGFPLLKVVYEFWLFKRPVSTCLSARGLLLRRFASNLKTKRCYINNY